MRAYFAIMCGVTLVLAAMCCPDIHARRARLNVSVAPQDTVALREGSLTVCSPCVPCNDGYSIDQVVISGFDKRAESNMESFFVTNTTDRVLLGLDFTLRYLTPDGRLLHSRHVEIDCEIPPAETRKTDIRSFDRQKSFYYRKSGAPQRRKASPFLIEIQMGCIRLRP